VTLAVLVLRHSYLKVLGSLLQTGLDRGRRVVILWHDGPTKPGERLEAPDLTHRPRRRADGTGLDTVAALCDRLPALQFVLDNFEIVEGRVARRTARTSSRRW
jgi:hypothetical protein